MSAPTMLRPLATPTEARAALAVTRRTLEAVLEPSDWHGPPGAPGSFVKKSGWRKVAVAFGLSVEIVSDRVERDRGGTIRRATAVVRATAPNGQSFDGDGHCSSDEPWLRGASDRPTIEHDVRATATTRAANRAIASLVACRSACITDGTPDENALADAPGSTVPTTAAGVRGTRPEVPSWTRHSPPDSAQHRAFRRALGRLLHGDVERCQSLYTTAWRHHGDGIPAGLAAFVIALEEQHRGCASPSTPLRATA
jgi:hypothetical protein